MVQISISRKQNVPEWMVYPNQATHQCMNANHYVYQVIVRLLMEVISRGNCPTSVR